MKANLPLWKALYKIAIALAIVFLFAACSPQQRLNRLIKHHPELTATADTIRDTVLFIPEHTDTAFKALPGDTVILKTETTRTQFIRLAPDSFFISTDRAADTVYINTPVPVVRTTGKIGRSGFAWKTFFFGLVCGLVLMGQFARRR